MKFFECFCILAIVGLVAAKNLPSNVNATAMISRYGADCSNLPDFTSFPHPHWCAEFLMCWEGELHPMVCPEGELFDISTMFCEDAATVDCVDSPPPEVTLPPPVVTVPPPVVTVPPPVVTPSPPDVDHEGPCPPPGSDELVFLPSFYCDEYYICINGNAVLRTCRPGLHWNIDEEICDDPWNAGCDETATQPPPDSDSPSDCVPGFYGQLPHPTNCNKFIHCNNGSRSIQRCQHLFHFDVNLRRCVFKNQADC